MYSEEIIKISFVVHDYSCVAQMQDKTRLSFALAQIFQGLFCSCFSLHLVMWTLVLVCENALNQDCKNNFGHHTGQQGKDWVTGKVTGSAMRDDLNKGQSGQKHKT